MTAQKHDNGKPRLDLVPWDAVSDVVRVLEFGARKYSAGNWAKGLAWTRLVAAAQRHLAAWQQGQEVDSESGLPHLAHASCCLLMLHASVLRGVGTDTRQDADNTAETAITVLQWGAINEGQ